MLPAAVPVRRRRTPPQRAQQPHLEHRGEKGHQRDAEEEGQHGAGVALAGVEEGPDGDADDKEHYARRVCEDGIESASH